MGNENGKAESKGFLQETIVDHEEAINCMALSEDGSLLVTGSEDKTARLWSTKTPQTECLGILKGHGGYITCVAVFDTFVVTGSADCTIRKWDMTSCECLFVYEGHTSRIFRLICTPEFIFSTSYDKTCKAWMFDASDLDEGEEEKACVRTFKGHNRAVVPVIFIPAEDLLNDNDDEAALNINPGDLIITGSSDHTARSWSFDTAGCLKVFKGHQLPISCMATDPLGKVLFTGSMDKTIRSWDINSGKCLKVFEGHTSPVMCMTVSKTLMYTGSSDGMARCWVTEFGDCTRQYKGHKHSVTSLKFHDGVLFTGCGDTCARAYDAKSGSLRRLYKGHESAISCVQVIDGKLYTGGADGTLRVWDAKNISDDFGQPIEGDGDYTSNNARLEALDKQLDDYIDVNDVGAVAKRDRLNSQVSTIERELSGENLAQ